MNNVNARLTFGFAMALAMALFPMLALAAPAQSEVAIEILMDDSGVLDQPELAQEYKLLLAAQLKELRKRRRSSTARINVTSSSFGRSVWVGTPLDLKRRDRAGEFIKDVTANPIYCQNLPAAFSALQMNIKQLERRGFKEIHVLVFSSLIDTPRPCKPNMTIRLPQLPPKLDFENLFGRSDAVSSITFMWVSAHQKKVWLEALEPVMAWADQRGIPFRLFDQESTIHEVNGALLGVMR